MLGELSFVSRVGGVAFHAIATPASDFYVASNLRIDYMRYKLDGQRLRIINNYDTVYASIPDWQLIPIIKYADNDYNSCVSLFGPKSDSDHFDIVYHSSFQNTLLGMRILQADMALMDTKTHWELPTFNYDTPLGLNERKPSRASSQQAASQIDRILKQYTFASWVLTDENISFSIKNRNIEFHGTPYYHFWITNIESDLIKYNKMRTKAMNDYTLKKGEDVLNNDVSKLKTLREKIETEKEKVIAVTAANDAMKNKFNLLLDFNKPVYTAILNTSHYAALFRYIKDKKPIVWSNILSEIRYVDVKPSVETPTYLPKN